LPPMAITCSDYKIAQPLSENKMETFIKTLVFLGAKSRFRHFLRKKVDTQKAILL